VDLKSLIWLFSEDKQPSYKHFPPAGAFSFKFSIAPSGETTDRSDQKKVRGCKNGTDLLYHHVGMVIEEVRGMVGIVGRAPAVDEKV